MAGVKSYKRRTKSGKVITVKSHNRKGTGRGRGKQKLNKAGRKEMADIYTRLQAMTGRKKRVPKRYR